MNPLSICIAHGLHDGMNLGWSSSLFAVYIWCGANYWWWSDFHMKGITEEFGKWLKQYLFEGMHVFSSLIVLLVLPSHSFNSSFMLIIIFIILCPFSRAVSSICSLLPDYVIRVRWGFCPKWWINCFMNYIWNPAIFWFDFAGM